MIKDVIILPVGSTEYHGALLPATTDAIVAERIAGDVSEKIKKSELLPLLPYGVSTEHKDFGSTVTIGADTYLRFMMDLLESIAREGSLVVIVNGHGGNSNILSVIEAEYNYAHTNSKVFVPSLYSKPVQDLSEKILGEFDTHAGSTEASLIAYYLDLADREETNQKFVKQMSGSLRFFKSSQVNTLGVIKDTDTLVMNAAAGKKLHDEIVKTIVHVVGQAKDDINKVKIHGPR